MKSLIMILKYFSWNLMVMDRTAQMENVQNELESVKKDNPPAYAAAKEHVKIYLKDHPELGKDKDLVFLLVYAICKIGNEEVNRIVSNHFRPYEGNFRKIVDGTSKSPEAMLRFLKTILLAHVERAMLAHKVYVLSRSNIRENVEFPNDQPDEDTGKKPLHRTFSVSLWDNDGKRIIPLFLVDDQVEPHSKLEAGKAYRMQIGNYNEEKDRWYASKDPSIIPLNGDSFAPDWVALADYIITNYPKIREPYDEVIGDAKSHPNRRYAMQAMYVKKPSYIELLPHESTDYVISLPHGSLTQDLGDEGELVVVGTFRKSVPKEGSPKTSDYVIFPELVLNLTSAGISVSADSGHEEGSKEDGKGDSPAKKSPEAGKGKKDDLDSILG